MGEPDGSRMTVKYDTEKIRISCQMTYARLRHALIMLNNYRFSTAAMTTRKHLRVTIYLRVLFVLFFHPVVNWRSGPAVHST